MAKPRSDGVQINPDPQQMSRIFTAAEQQASGLASAGEFSRRTTPITAAASVRIGWLGSSEKKRQ